MFIETRGWKRELIREGIEPNPGPTWKEIKEILSKKFDNNSIPLAIYAKLEEIRHKIEKEHTNDPLFILDESYVESYIQMHQKEIHPSIYKLLSSLKGEILFYICLSSHALL